MDIFYLMNTKLKVNPRVVVFIPFYEIGFVSQCARMNDILDDEIAFKDIELKIISLNMFQNTNFLSKVIGYLSTSISAIRQPI